MDIVWFEEESLDLSSLLKEIGIVESHEKVGFWVWKQPGLFRLKQKPGWSGESTWPFPTILIKAALKRLEYHYLVQ